MKYVVCFLALFTAIPNLKAQTCTCSQNFDWLKTTFENNDAGFEYIIKQKGEDDYKKHTAVFAGKTASISSETECMETLYQWLRYFRKGHIAIEPITTNTTAVSTASAAVTENEKISLRAEWLSNYGDTFQIADYRGLWQTGSYTIAIVQQNQQWLGVIVASKNEAWKPGEIKLKISQSSEGHKAVYYMGDRSKRDIETMKMIGKNLLQLDFIALQRLNSKWIDTPALQLHIRCMQAQKTFLQKIDAKNCLLRIPSFNMSEKRDIDSVIASNKKLLSNTEHLIIDLRNNGGGSDMSFQELLPYLYTQPIREVGVKFKSTELNNKRMLDMIADPDYTAEDKIWAKQSFDTLQKHLGEYVDLNPNENPDITMKGTKKSPKRIIIIVNENCGSTTEQFLLAAKQSQKVKLLGTSTFGALDISNMYFVQNPCGQFQLGYCLSISKRLPDMIIDSRGIQPDFVMDRGIEETDWIERALQILNTK